ncbi:hypothetical protein EGH21_17095 [Halomicroarcula sp. F13]|uniref:Uncharacterized protein n=1 Tax=Haloarcula rubra TaxID=2487747 RepID=A0AAW4PVR7_9EURY|nr:hypothetical protein [Halomicroarcula rubra]MBX0324744.1 hypothetical protein [Halomicroarcula rubra]
MSNDAETGWDSNREGITYEQGQEVLRAQKEDIDDIDDKALRTVRVTALLLGVGATGVRVISISDINNYLAVASLSTFLLSLFFGVVVYDESNEVIGPTSNYLGRMSRYEVDEPWEKDFFHQLEGWIEDNQEIVEKNAYLLRACEIFFVTGLALGAAALLNLETGELLVILILLIVATVVTLLAIGARISDN